MITEKEELLQLVKECSSFTEILRKQGKAVSGAALKVLKGKLDEYLIDYHFVLKHNIGKAIPLEEKLQKNTNINASKLKILLIKEGLKEDVCECCGQGPIWNGKPLTLQLDHINGDHYDNRLENLQVLCPNCHTQTETFGTKRFRTINHCVDCGCEINKKSTRCLKCSATYNRETMSREDKPSKEELLELIKSETFVDIGKKYNCSDNNVRKWCKKYGLPYTKKQIKELYFS